MSAFKFYYSTKFDFDAIEGFHLLQDHVGTRYTAPWDDFDYVVTFQLYRVADGNRERFGHVKVLAKGYKDTSAYFEKEGKKVENSFDVTDLFSPDRIISLASDLDYYRRLRQTLHRQALRFLRGICDGSYYYRLHKDYSKWDGFSSSLLRSNSKAQATLKKGTQIARGKYQPADKFSICVDELSDRFESITFNFDNTRELGKTNVNLLIGRNGSGKSHVLRHLVDLITGIAPTETAWPYFHKVVVAAYSPFETFRTENELTEASQGHDGDSPPDDEVDSRDIAERRRLLVNEYAYVGFKNTSSTFCLEWPKECSARALAKILGYDSENLWWTDKSRFRLLFDTLRQSIVFDEIALCTGENEFIPFSVEKGDERMDYASAIANAHFEGGLVFLKDGKAVPLSSGQTIYSYLLPCLVAEIEDESLLILDEPELYLHPAMEIGLINMLKTLLEATKSNAIIATHSSILAREVERSGVVILRKEGEKTTATNPGFETFGQSVELIMGEAFDDYRTPKAYEQTLDAAYDKYQSRNAALEALAPQVGNEALAYLAAKGHEDAEITIEVRPS